MSPIQPIQNLEPLVSIRAKINALINQLTGKANTADIANFETTTQLNARDTNNRSRANHTGTQPISSVNGLQAALDAVQVGSAATITVGTVNTLAAGESATVTNSGTSSAAVLNFGIPQGADAEAGSGGGSNIEIVRSGSQPDTPPLYDGTTGISFFIRIFSEYGSPAARLYFGADTTGDSFESGWQRVQNF